MSNEETKKRDYIFIKTERLDCKHCGKALSLMFTSNGIYLGCMCNMLSPLISHAISYNKIFEKFLELRAEEKI